MVFSLHCDDGLPLEGDGRLRRLYHDSVEDIHSHRESGDSEVHINLKHWECVRVFQWDLCLFLGMEVLPGLRDSHDIRPHQLCDVLLLLLVASRIWAQDQL